MTIVSTLTRLVARDRGGVLAPAMSDRAKAGRQRLSAGPAAGHQLPPPAAGTDVDIWLWLEHSGRRLVYRSTWADPTAIHSLWTEP